MSCNQSSHFERCHSEQDLWLQPTYFALILNKFCIKPTLLNNWCMNNKWNVWIMTIFLSSPTLVLSAMFSPNGFSDTWYLLSFFQISSQFWCLLLDDSILSDVSLFIDMFQMSRFRIYVFTLIGALVGILQCKWINAVIRLCTTSFFLSHSLCYALWIQTNLSERFEAFLQNFFFQLFFFCWWKVDVSWPKIIFFISPINHTDVTTGR